MNKFLQEILEQPKAIENIVDFYTSAEGMNLLKKIKTTLSEKNIEQVIFTGMGSSFFISHGYLSGRVPDLYR